MGAFVGESARRILYYAHDGQLVSQAVLWQLSVRYLAMASCRGHAEV